MAKGINQSAKEQLLDLEPTAILELFEIYYNYTQDNQEVIYIHAANNNKVSKPVVFNGQEYLPIALETDGFESLGNQKLPRPKVKFANAGMYFSSLLRRYNNLSKAKVIRKRTFAKFLDNENFPNNQNPFGSANSDAILSEDKFFVNRKISENKLFVELELVSSLELENVNIPSRTINSNYCPWVYRGLGCNYGSDTVTTGDGLDRPVGDIKNRSFVIASGNGFQLNPNIFTIASKAGDNVFHDGSNNGVLVNKGRWEEGVNYNVGDYVYTQSNLVQEAQEATNYYDIFPVFYVAKANHLSDDGSHPSTNRALWMQDGCSKDINGCKLRFFNDDLSDGINNKGSMPFGGFPGVEGFNY